MRGDELPPRLRVRVNSDNLVRQGCRPSGEHPVRVSTQSGSRCNCGHAFGTPYPGHRPHDSLKWAGSVRSGVKRGAPARHTRGRPETGEPPCSRRTPLVGVPRCAPMRSRPSNDTGVPSGLVAAAAWKNSLPSAIQQSVPDTCPFHFALRWRIRLPTPDAL